MAVGWVLRKVMGKRDDPQPAAAALETESSSTGQENGHFCCRKSTWRWIVTVVLSLQLLVFLLISFRGHHGKHPSFPVQAPIMFMFKLERSASLIESYKSELESNLSSHIHAENMKVSLYSVNQMPNSCLAEVRFQLLPATSNTSYDVKDLRGNLVKLFLCERNLSLTPTTFGKVFDFQINRMQGGLTIVPERSQKSLSKRSPLFNFTLLNGTISSVSKSFKDFKLQLASGICLRDKEVLITRLTNLNGSTVEAPVIVQTAIFRGAGRHLSATRLKQLAHRITAFSKHRRNLGLNQSVFGEVWDLQLSSVLLRFLSHSHAPAPSPSPSPAPGPSQGSAAAKDFDYSYGRYGHAQSVFLAPAPGPASSIQTGFADSPGVVPASAPASDLFPQQQGIASVPAEPPSSSAARAVERLAVVMILVLMASVVLV